MIPFSFCPRITSTAMNRSIQISVVSDPMELPPSSSRTPQYVPLPHTVAAQVSSSASGLPLPHVDVPGLVQAPVNPQLAVSGPVSEM